MSVTRNQIVTTQAQDTDHATCINAKSTYSDLTNAVLLTTAGANGSIITRLTAMPRATVTATQLQLYVCKASAPTVPYLINSALMAAYTMAQTTAAPVTDLAYSPDSPLKLGPGDLLYCAIGVSLSGGVVFEAEREDY